MKLEYDELVSNYAFNLNLRHYAVVACILHDVVDDTPCEIHIVKNEFGSVVANLVSDVSTLVVRCAGSPRVGST